MERTKCTMMDFEVVVESLVCMQPPVPLSVMLCQDQAAHCGNKGFKSPPCRVQRQVLSMSVQPGSSLRVQIETAVLSMVRTAECSYNPSWVPASYTVGLEYCKTQSQRLPSISVWSCKNHQCQRWRMQFITSCQEDYTGHSEVSRDQRSKIAKCQCGRLYESGICIAVCMQHAVYHIMLGRLYWTFRSIARPEVKDC